MRLTRRAVAAAGVLASLLLGASACGTSEVGQAVPSIEPEPTPIEQLEYLFEGINPIVSRSHAGIVGTIEKVSQPKWNSVTGEPFENFDTEPPLRPIMYRYATVRVERVLWDSPEAHGTRPFGPRGLRAKPNEELEVFTWGDGTATGGRVADDDIRENNISGPIEEGRRVLWILEWRAAHFREGDGTKLMPVLGIANDFQGSWTLRDDQAVSPMRGRTVPAEPLIERLLAERAAGRQDDRLTRGTVNPLE